MQRYVDFPGDSDGKEPTCNAGEPSSILGLGRPLEKGMATHSGILAWRISMDRGAWWAMGHGVTKSQTRLSNVFTFLTFAYIYIFNILKIVII